MVMLKKVIIANNCSSMTPLQSYRIAHHTISFSSAFAVMLREQEAKSPHLVLMGAAASAAQQITTTSTISSATRPPHSRCFWDVQNETLSASTNYLDVLV